MVIRKYVSGNEKDILELFCFVFNQKMTEEVWNWRFQNNPFTQEMFIYLMWEKDQLIGHYAVSPVEMRIDGNIVKTALSMTTMTHPDHGGKGIFSKLASSLYSDLQEKYGYKMVWGFPNNNSHYGFIKNLGWKDIAVEPMLSGKTSGLRLNREASFSYGLKNGFDENTTARLANNLKVVAINKTKEYLNWRYIENPAADYKIIYLEDSDGIVVYKVIRSFTDEAAFEIDLMEISFEADINILSALINAVLKEEESHKITQFNIWRSVFTDDRILFEKLGFKITLPLTYLSYLEFEETPVTSNYKNWEIGLGYSDVF